MEELKKKIDEALILKSKHQASLFLMPLREKRFKVKEELYYLYPKSKIETYGFTQIKRTT